MKVLIGCPVYKRDWILPFWFEAIENQDFPIEDIGFVFELAPDDYDTHKVLFEWHAKHPEVFFFDATIREDIEHQSHAESNRVWTPPQYERMIRLRNNLLDKVNCVSPDRYFSLDSDIILENSKTISTLVELTERYDAVGTLAFMSPWTSKNRWADGLRFPSVMTWMNEPGGNAARVPPYPLGGLFHADIIMASKMMSKPVFENVRYSFHPKGEDLGWSYECAKQGFELACASYIYTPHIMHRWMLNEWRAHGDPRYQNGRLIQTI